MGPPTLALIIFKLVPAAVDQIPASVVQRLQQNVFTAWQVQPAVRVACTTGAGAPEGPLPFDLQAIHAARL